MMKRLVAILISCLAFFTGSGDVLLWQVDKNDTVFETGQTLSKFLEGLPYSPWSEDNPDAPYTEYLAQVVVVNNNGQTMATLPVAYQTNIGEPDPHNFIYEFNPDVTAVEIGHPNAGYVGADWNQSKVSRDLLEEYLFQVQILQDAYGDESVILYSDYVRGLGLDDEYVYTESSLYPLTESTWRPGYIIQFHHHCHLFQNPPHPFWV